MSPRPSRTPRKPRDVFPLLGTVLAPWLLALVGCGGGPAPEAPAPVEVTGAPAAVASEYITSEAVMDHIAFLAADEMRGRDTPSPELERAAEYLAARLDEAGLQPAGDDGSFIQRWTFQTRSLDTSASHVRVEPSGESPRELEYARDYFAIPSPPVLVEGTPVYAADPQAAATALPAEAEGQPLFVSLPEGLGPDFALAIQGAMQARASGVVLLMDEETDESAVHQIAEALEAGAAGQMPLPVLGVRHEVGEELLASAGIDPEGGRDPPARVLEGLRVSFSFQFRDESHEVPNVVAMREGSDPELADEYVVLSAHFDHVGVGPPDERGDSIYSGADDNASGTAAVLRAAEAFAQLPEAPSRSVVFLFVSGEEKGLLGSMHYADQPTVPAAAIVANLNLDMVSRNHPDTLYAIGEEYTSLGERAREVAAEHPELGLVVAPDPEPEEQAFLRSDHYSFVQRGIPALMLTTWLHDDYHVPSDLPERVDAEKAARVTRFTFLLAHAVASAAQPPRWTDAGEALLRSLEGMGPG